jgi:hypothetical protein
MSRKAKRSPRKTKTSATRKSKASATRKRKAATRKSRARASRKSKAAAKRKVGARIIDILFANEVTPNRFDDTKAAAAAARGRKGAAKRAMLTRRIRGWRVAESLQRLLAQINQMAPNRNKASDGSIGDPNHQLRDSDHNPWVTEGNLGVVTARDFTHDPAGGCDAQKIADSIVAARDPRVKYIIWNRQICNSQVQPWKWRPYGGSNPHTKHVHISVQPQKAKYDDTTNWQLAQMQLGRMAKALGAANVGDMPIAWGKKVSPAFKRKVIEISGELGIDPNFLMAAMAFESMRTFSSNVQNPSSKATGLIQFMPSTARALGTSIEALKRMTPVAQLDFVRQYFLPYRGRLKDITDVYMAILWPKAVGQPASYILFAQDSLPYKLNRGLDVNTDGAVTKVEAASRVQQHLIEGMRVELRG